MTVPKRFIAMLGALSALAPLSIDASLPALPLMARDLHAADWLMQATLGAFMSRSHWAGSFSGRSPTGSAEAALHICFRAVDKRVSATLPSRR